MTKQCNTNLYQEVCMDEKENQTYPISKNGVISFIHVETAI